MKEVFHIMKNPAEISMEILMEEERDKAILVSWAINLIDKATEKMYDTRRTYCTLCRRKDAERFFRAMNFFEVQAALEGFVVKRRNRFCGYTIYLDEK